jgi:peptidoglycan hydrolase CwlO-like protein
MKPANLILIATISVLFTTMLSSCKPKQTTINGQVFIVTQGGLNIRLGAVEVLLIEKREATNYLQKISAEINDRIKSETAAALQAHQQDIKNAQSEVNEAQENFDKEKPKFQEAQNKFNEAKGKYDELMASAPFLTNSIYVKIKNDLGLREHLIPTQQQFIKTQEAAVAETAIPGTPIWVAGSHFNARGYWNGGDEEARLALHDAYQKYLAIAEQDLVNNQKQIKADIEALQKIETTFAGFQSEKLDGEKSELNEEKARLDAATTMLDSKESYLKSLEGQNPIYSPTPAREDCFSDFSPPIISKVNTDADGNFSIVCPTRGRFSIFAAAQRPAESERYCWLIDAPNQSIPARVLLNNNLVKIDPDGYFKP